MIRKTQIRFITLIMSILLAVFAVVFCACIVLLNLTNSRGISSKLDDAVFYFENTDGDFLVKDGVYARVKEISNNVFSVEHIEFDKTSFSNESARKLIFDICKKEIDYGNIDEYYFKFYPSISVQNEYTIMTANMSAMEDEYKSDILYVGIIFICVYILLYVLVYGLSFRIIQPLKDNMSKQKQFISNISHELKTPLTIISASTDVLINNGNNQWLSNIKSQTNRMDGLVADMLTLAKLDEGVPLEVQDFCLSDEIFSAVLPFEALAFEKGKFIQTQIEKDVNYHGDKNSVKKLLNILVDNAIKYSKENSTIKIYLENNTHPTIKIFNEGSEIQPYEAQKIFNRFYRGDNSRSRESGGSGLGLAIAKGICDVNKWKISALSKYKESMCITVVL